MIINEDSLKKLIEMVMEELSTTDTGTTYEFKSDDPDLQSKTSKLTNDSTLFDKSKDKIEVKTENVHKIADIKRMVMERKYHGKAYKKSELIEMLTKKEDVCECGEIKEEENNPWAICSANIDKSKNPEKHERCVKNVKKQNNIKK